MADRFALPPDFSAVVVGGAGGIGGAVVSLLLDLGARVTATGVDQAALAVCTLAHQRLTLTALDVTNDQAVEEFATQFDRVDALVNCAGILKRDLEFNIATFQHVLDVNLTGTFRTCSAFRRALGKTHGSIVNIASMNATQALPRLPAYCASKGGVVMLTKSLAVAWADQGIRVNAVAPGYIETAINEVGRQDLAFYNRIAERTAFKRWGQPDEVAGAVVFLLLPASAYATGTVVTVDGGFLAG